MKLSFHTVCIIFGVTLVHLVVIAAISPTGSEGMTLYGPADVDAPDLDSAEGASEASLTIEDVGRPMVTESAEADTPVDLPARRREDAGLAPNPLADPVASTRPPAAQPRS